MKVLLSSAGAFDRGFGGGQRYVQGLACELQRRGHDVHVIARGSRPGGQENVALERHHYRGIPVIGLEANPARITAAEQASEMGPILSEALRRLLVELSPEVMHINGWKAPLTTLCREMGIPHVVTAHHPGVACPAGALLTPESNLCRVAMSPSACVPCYCRQRGGGGTLSKLLGALPRWVYRPVGTLLNRVGNPTYVGRALMYPYLVENIIAGRSTALACAELFIAPSQAIAEVLMRNGVEPARIQVIPHGIEALPRVPLSSFEGRPVRFGYVGQITRAKGLHVLFEAFASLPEGLSAELHIIGGAQHPWEERYLAEAMACCSNNDRVILHGHVPHAELAAAVAQIDVLALPAIYLEVFGLVVLEAFSAGRPVIASRCGGPEELIRHGIDGLLFPRNNVSALADIMKTLIQHPEQIAAMAANIRPVRTLAEHVDDLERLYRRVVGKCA